MKFSIAALVALIALVAVSGFAVADRLPNQTPENQIFSVDTVVDVTGFVEDKTTVDWIIASPGAIPTGILGNQQAVAVVSYTDSIMTNGGKLSLNKNFDFNSKNQNAGLYNIEADKVMTYASTDGAFLVGEEIAMLDVAGNWAASNDQIRCVFSGADKTGLPAFCNIVKAQNTLTNMNSGQVSTQTQIRAVAKTADVSAALNQQIAVTPDANSGSGFADGTVATSYAGHILEARNIPDNSGKDLPKKANSYNDTASDYTWSDSTAVTGGIKNFQKVFNYESGFNL